MAQSFVVQSEKLRDKLNALLPSQNRNSIGVDLSGSTQIIPIVDLTEVAQGSNVRQDLQTALSLTSATTFFASNSSSTIANTTGYWRVTCTIRSNGANLGSFSVTDGATTKEIVGFAAVTGLIEFNILDIVVFLKAGDSLICSSDGTGTQIRGSLRQIATVTGDLVNP